jgi:uncharacterized damage-inducible protein DinB
VRIEPDPAGSDLELLHQYLDYQRGTVMIKTDGLSADQLAFAAQPSSLTLGGLLNHLALVEDDWMEHRFQGRPERSPWTGVDWDADPDWDFRTAAGMDPSVLRQRYADACERSRAVVAEAAGAEQMSARTLRDGRRFSLRWVLLHLIEETARHAGHADLIREAVDGLVGE